MPRNKQQKRASAPKFALLSVSDKTGIVEFATGLKELGYQIISTGGTGKTLQEAGISIIPIQEITGNPESFDGRMKTISFEIESALLYDRTNPKHQKEAKNLKIKNIELVCCNLYPFEETIKNKQVVLETAAENIDVGGPTMVRSAAKNFKNVLVLIDPSDYSRILENLRKNEVSQKTRQELAAKAFYHLSFYDSQIARYLSCTQFPEELTIPGRMSYTLRYGENPHQKAAVYFEPNTNSPLQKLTHITGRSLSYVNITDISSGIEVVRYFSKPAAVVIKHNSPSGIALGQSAAQALERSVAADAESAFGGVIVLNTPLDLKAAKTFADFKEENGVLVDIVAAPSVTQDAIEFVKGIRKSTGIYTFGKIPKNRSNTNHLRFFDGGFVMQDWDNSGDNVTGWQIVSQKKPTPSQMEQMKLAWKMIGRIKSNTVLVVDKKIPMTRGIGSGQTSRVRSTKIALEQAGKYAKNGILASDSFFPFDDSVKLAAQKEIACIVEQGGSINDKLSIEAANQAGIVMVFTNERKFWH